MTLAAEFFQPQRFFSTVVSAALLREELVQVAAVLQLVIMGDREDTAFYFDSTDSPVEIGDGIHDDPDLWIAIHERHVLAWISAQLDLDAALADGSVQFHGNRAALIRLVEVISRTSSPDLWR